MYDAPMAERERGRLHSLVLVIAALFFGPACTAQPARGPILDPSSARVSSGIPGRPSPSVLGPAEDSIAREPGSALSTSEHASTGFLQPRGTASSVGERLEHAAGGSWTIGEVGPYRLEALGPRGAWVALCAASGDNLSLRLFAAESTAAVQLGLAGAIPRKIDRLLAWSGDGRYLVTLEGSRLWLLDLNLGAEFDLSSFAPDRTTDREPDHRSLSFSADGQELALLTASGSIQIITLPITSAAPRSLTPLRAPWRIRHSGGFLVSESGPSGSWPVPKTKFPPLRCESSPLALRAYARASEPSAAFFRQTELARRGTTVFEEAPGFVMTLGENWVRREEDGRLLLVQGRTQKQLTSARCGARVRYADALRELLVVACEKYRPRPDPAEKKAKPKKPEFSFPLFLISRSSVRELGIEDARAGFDIGPLETGPRTRTPELLPLTSGGQTFLVDLSARMARPLLPGERVLAVFDRTALVQKGQIIAPVAFGQGSARHDQSALPLETAPFAPILSAGPYVSLGRLILHPTEEPRTLYVDPIALSPDGAALEPAARSGSWFEGPFVISRGPLPAG